MQKITPFLWFDGNAEEAMNFYASIFKNAKISNVTRVGEQVLVASFELEGQQFMAMNGGPMFKHTPAFSLYVSCDTQQEVDDYWDKLSAAGEKSKCGWLKDKYGISWQIIPTILGKLMGDKDRAKAKKVMDAMLKMEKIEIAVLEKAFES